MSSYVCRMFKGIPFWNIGLIKFNKSSLFLPWLCYLTIRYYFSPEVVLCQKVAAFDRSDFEGMRHHLHLQNWDMMLVGDIKTKWLGFKTVLLDLVEKFCPLARSKRQIATPWLSMHIVAMQKEKKWLYKKFLLARSQEHWPCYKNYDRLYTFCGVFGRAICDLLRLINIFNEKMGKMAKCTLNRCW